MDGLFIQSFSRTPGATTSLPRQASNVLRFDDCGSESFGGNFVRARWQGLYYSRCHGCKDHRNNGLDQIKRFSGKFAYTEQYAKAQEIHLNTLRQRRSQSDHRNENAAPLRSTVTRRLAGIAQPCSRLVEIQKVRKLAMAALWCVTMITTCTCLRVLGPRSKPANSGQITASSSRLATLWI